MTFSRSAACQVPLDRSVPALMLKIGQYPVHSGGVGVLRSLGRCGVPVYAVTEPALPPTAVSRYCTGHFVSRFTGRERPEDLVPWLLAVGERIGTRSVVLATDDEAAALIAAHREELAGHFLLPDVDPGLPGRLASKTGLFELCRQHGVAAPATVTPGCLEEVARFAATARFPVVVKNADPWHRRRRPIVQGTTVVPDSGRLMELASRGGDRPSLILQEYLPDDQAVDWITHLYADYDSDGVLMLTGRKVRSWPPHAGPTACAQAVFNPELAALSERFCKEIGYGGIGDLDWRRDLRTGEYNLLDFNPRAGNNFRLFENEAGVDVVRAQHLDLTGRPVPRGRQREDRQLIVEHMDGPARIAYWIRDRHRPAQRGKLETELAWLATDDPLPAVVMIPHAVRALAGDMVRRLKLRLEARREGRRAGPPSSAQG